MRRENEANILCRPNRVAKMASAIGSKSPHNAIHSSTTIESNFDPAAIKMTATYNRQAQNSKNPESTKSKEPKSMNADLPEITQQEKRKQSLNIHQVKADDKGSKTISKFNLQRMKVGNKILAMQMGSPSLISRQNMEVYLPHYQSDRSREEVKAAQLVEFKQTLKRIEEGSEPRTGGHASFLGSRPT